MSERAQGRVLIVDDDADLLDLLVAGLTAQGYETEGCTSAEMGLAALGERRFDLILADINLPGMSGIEFCSRVVEERPDQAVMVMTAFGSMKSAVAAIRAGAYDYITKPLDVDAVGLRIGRVVREGRIRDEARRLRAVVQVKESYGGLLGSSPAMRKVYDLLERVAGSDASVLVTGESGTGKELVARAIHDQGPRKGGPFVAVNCSAVPENLLESELFGHSKGAFTDARNDRLGLFPQANGGTLFLDEIGEIPMTMQPKLLRALEERRVRPVGSNTETDFDVRVVAATNRDLEAAVEEGRFREDLYFRINVIHVDLPPLRSRGTDVLSLAQHFLGRYSLQAGKQVQGISPAAAQRLCDYEWPGNVRELRNCMERAVALTRHTDVQVEDLPERVSKYRRSHMVIASDDPTELVPLEEVERRYILRVVETVAGNKTMAAKILGLDRKTLYRKLERYKQE
ncbi:MAG: sigma-54-dependent Fis family transcriptional regulator [Myxococcales bacterium]|nr:sigma-54-dependent Fis family transcriptional regulator [Myxococcales bacterium]MCB9714335.1 sigma-54-dependent Fis family transcriptional regulator [Myxococcales bacterium]